MQAHPALVLNADFRPLSYFPLSLMSWQDAVSAVVKDTVAVVAHYDAWVRSPSRSIQLPSVVALRSYLPMRPRVAFTRVLTPNARFAGLAREAGCPSKLQRRRAGRSSHCLMQDVGAVTRPRIRFIP